MRDCTLVFLVKKADDESVSQVCLALKKRGFGEGKWNGVGGKVEAGETCEEAARREAKEEIGVEVGPLQKVGELAFYFSHNPAWDQLVHVYLCDEWEGEPAESEEMAPKWFDAEELPLEHMWVDDPHWLPHVLGGKSVKATFTFGEGDSLLDKAVEVVDTL